MSKPLNDIALSQYGHASADPSPVNHMMEAFASDFRDGVDINLGVGYVNERTIPSDHIEKALHQVLSTPDKYRQSLNYGGPAGADNLIDALKQFLITHNVGGLTAEILDQQRIIIGPNGATSLLESIAYVLPKGLVITSDPMYYIYTEFLERCGFDLLSVPEDEHGINVDLLREKIDAIGDQLDDLQFFYVVTINNPSCAILTNERREQLVTIARDVSQRLGRRIPVILDRAYEDLIHDSGVTLPKSGLLFDDDGLVYEIGTLSKVLAPALRIGYMIGRDGPFMHAMIQRTSDAGFSAPLITQEIAGWLLDHQIEAQLDSVRNGYREKSLATRRWLDEYLGDEIESVVGGQAGFYLYITFKHVETHETSAFFHCLTRTTGNVDTDGPADNKHPRVIYIPGEHCVHSRGDLAAVGQRQLRLSYGFEEPDAIEKAIQHMRDAVRYARQA